jgi:hypothetical protein
MRLAEQIDLAFRILKETEPPEPKQTETGQMWFPFRTGDQICLRLRESAERFLAGKLQEELESG